DQLGAGLRVEPLPAGKQPGVPAAKEQQVRVLAAGQVRLFAAAAEAPFFQALDDDARVLAPAHGPQPGQSRLTLELAPLVPPDQETADATDDDRDQQGDGDEAQRRHGLRGPAAGASGYRARACTT